MKRTFGDASLLGPLFAWMGCQMAYVPQASISGRWCSMRRRGQKVPQELLQARRGFELVGKNIAGRREGCLEFDCPSGLLRTRFLAGVYTLLHVCCCFAQALRWPQPLCMCAWHGKFMLCLRMHVRSHIWSACTCWAEHAKMQAFRAHAVHACTLRLSPRRDLA